MVSGDSGQGKTSLCLAGILPEGLIAPAGAEGKAFALTLQDTWQWQMHASVTLEDMTHETLWRQLLRWLASDVPGPVEIAVSEDRPATLPSN